MTWKELYRYGALSVIGKLLYYIGAISIKPSRYSINDPEKVIQYSTKLRVLHPIGLVYVLVHFIVTPFVAMFVKEGMINIYKGTSKDLAWW